MIQRCMSKKLKVVMEACGYEIEAWAEMCNEIKTWIMLKLLICVVSVDFKVNLKCSCAADPIAAAQHSCSPITALLTTSNVNNL